MGKGRWGAEVGGSLLDINYSRGRMSELATRKGERTKKVPKHMQYDDADYGGFLSVRAVETKEKVPNGNQINQISRLLQKFIASINQKIRQHHQGQLIQRSSNEDQNFNESDVKRGTAQNGDAAGQKPSGISGKRGKDSTGGQSKAGKGQAKKTAQGGRLQPTSSSNLQQDLQYHGMLNEHVRSAYPNIGSLSPDMLKGLGIPKQLLEPQNGKSRLKEEKQRSQQMLRNIKGGKDGKDDLKPFKRQSFHVAIAYHIHIKKVKGNNPSNAEIDPTFAARKLRENQNQPKQ